MTILKAKFQAGKKLTIKVGLFLFPKNQEQMLGRLTVEIEGWIVDIKKSSPTKEEDSPLNALETRSSKMNPPPLLEEAQQRRVMSCSSYLKKGGHLCRKEKNGGKREEERRRGPCSVES